MGGKYDKDIYVDQYCLHHKYTLWEKVPKYHLNTAKYQGQIILKFHLSNFFYIYYNAKTLKLH